MAIVRDSNGIIVQPNPDNPSAPPDGGDSASRTGIMAMCGSREDMMNMPKFLINGGVCRNPSRSVGEGYDETDPANISRDQIIPFFSMRYKNIQYWKFSEYDSYKLAAYNASRSWFINKDFYDPSLRLYLRSAVMPYREINPGLRFFGMVFLWINLIYNTKINPDAEMNQFLCVCNRFGPKWVGRLYKWHPGIFENLQEYWCGWRNQPEIYEAIKNQIWRQVVLS